jgi:hypothetical protein
MKNFIKNRLHEDLRYHGVSNAEPETDEFKMGLAEAGNQSTIAYHGTRHKITKFSDKFVGGEQAKDQEGPGIYFASEPKEAIEYATGGGYVYKVNLNFGKLLSNEPSMDLDYLTQPVTKLIKAAPNWKRVAKGYSDDIDEGLDEMVYKFIGTSQSEKEVFVTLFDEVYKNDPILYVRNMTKLGYDGVNLPTKGGGSQYAVYNVKSIQIIDSKQIN